ncbi:MAG: hypothetical protein P1S60_16210, partial [Anaerolineae bacterium]|nr:hypothetical protein [Anaerolineae bacterium]
DGLFPRYESDIMTITLQHLQQAREHRYRRTPERAVSSPEQAREYVEDLGFCFFWPIKDIEMPSLFHAIAGRVRDVPNEHGDPDISRSWGWKDDALDKRWWYYGKLLRRRATLISLELLPYFYAASENFGDLTDYLDEYRDGLLSSEAKDIHEALLERGPLDTIRLRREASMSAESAKSRFNRGLVELQVGLKVIPVGVAETGAWHYSFIYELLPRYYPQVPLEARNYGRAQSQARLIQRYIDNAVAVERSMVQKIFYVLKWTPREIQSAVNHLIETDKVWEGEVNGGDYPLLVSTTVM